MNIVAGIEFLVFLVFFGTMNYYFMLKRYDNDQKVKRSEQLIKISGLYPKGTFIKI